MTRRVARKGIKNIFFLILFIIVSPRICRADIFQKPPTPDPKLEEALQQDVRGEYFKNVIDYNVYEGERRYEHRNAEGFIKDKVPAGIRKFNMPMSIKDAMVNRDFANQYTEDVIEGLENHPLMTYQYSSPAKADLYKHLETLAHMRMALRYQQFQDLERAVDDPLDKLRKQAELDCLRGRKRGSSLEQAFETCLSNEESNAPLKGLNDPLDGTNNINGTVNIVYQSMERVRHNNINWSSVEEILPQVKVSESKLSIKPPELQIRQFFYQQRKEALKKLNQLIKKHMKNNGKEPEPDPDYSGIEDFYVASSPLTPAQVRNIVLLPEPQRTLSINKLASQFAYLEVMDRYGKAYEWLNRAMLHPAIGAGYKNYIKSVSDYMLAQMDELDGEKGRLAEYGKFMEGVVAQADEQRAAVQLGGVIARE